MDSNISTTFVPLRPPFMIIKYGHDIGMHIGTLIATTQIQGDDRHPFRIETHSYPVVAYENKETLSQDRNLFFHDIMEGVVWNRVELKKVTTLCMYNSHLSWPQFISMLWDDHLRAPRTQKLQTRMFKVLKKYGVIIEPPKAGNYTINLRIGRKSNLPEIVSSDKKDIFGLNVEWDDDLEMLENRIVDDLVSYLGIIAPGKKVDGWKLVYETTEEELRPLVDRLNANRKANSFYRAFRIDFELSPIEPYEEETTDEGERAADPENQQREKNVVYSIFHENINENAVATTLLTINRLGLGPKQFAKAVQEFFISIGWLVDQIDTHFICWMNNHQIKLGRAKDLQHIKQNIKMDALKEDLKKTFQFQNPIGIWEDNSDYFKKNRLRINTGEK